MPLDRRQRSFVTGFVVDQAGNRPHTIKAVFLATLGG